MKIKFLYCLFVILNLFQNLFSWILNRVQSNNIKKCLLLLALSSLVNANPATNLAHTFKNINTIQGNFVQKVYDQNNHIISTSKGNFILQKPNRFRWNVKSPMRQLTIADGKNIWLYQPDLQQATVNPMTKKIGQTPLAILTGSTKMLTRYYTITQLNKNNFILTAKTNNNNFYRIQLTFAKQKIQKMILQDNLGQKTMLDFNKVVINKNINRKSFEFNPPKGIDIIRA